jgi:hypothetical protein
MCVPPSVTIKVSVVVTQKHLLNVKLRSFWFACCKVLMTIKGNLFGKKVFEAVKIMQM